MALTLERRNNNSPVNLVTRDEGADGIATLEAYIATWDADSYDLGGYTEQIQRGAFGDSLTKNDIVCLVNHDHSEVVGRVSAGTLTLEEDDHGLKAVVKLPDTTAGRDLQVSTARGDLKGCSFGFQIEGQEWSKRGDTDLCTLTKIDLFEVSVGVTFPAYSQTSMQLRSLKVQLEKLRRQQKQNFRRKHAR